MQQHAYPHKQWTVSYFHQYLSLIVNDKYPGASTPVFPVYLHQQIYELSFTGRTLHPKKAATGNKYPPKTDKYPPLSPNLPARYLEIPCHRHTGRATCRHDACLQKMHIYFDCTSGNASKAHSKSAHDKFKNSFFYVVIQISREFFYFIKGFH